MKIEAVDFFYLSMPVVTTEADGRAARPRSATASWLRAPPQARPAYSSGVASRSRCWWSWKPG